MPRAGLDPARVVASAGDLVDREGYDQLNLAAVAAQLGVRVPSLYKHVGGLGDLRARLAVAGMRDLDAALRDAAVGRAGRDALVAVARAYRDYAHSHPGRYTAALRAPDPADEEAGRLTTSLIALLLAVMAGYGLQGDAAVHGVRTLRAALHGFTDLEQAGGFRMPLDLDASFAQLVDVLDAGLRAAAASHA